MDSLLVTAYPQTMAWVEARDHLKDPSRCLLNDLNLPSNVQLVPPPRKRASEFDFGTLVGKTITDFCLRYKSIREQDGHFLIIHFDDHSSLCITTGEPDSAARKGAWPRVRIDPSIDSLLRMVKGDDFGMSRKGPRSVGVRIEAIITNAYRTSKTSDWFPEHSADPSIAREVVHKVLGLRLHDLGREEIDEADRSKWLGWISCDRRRYSKDNPYMLVDIEFFDIELSMYPGPNAKGDMDGIEYSADETIEMRCEHCQERVYREQAVRDKEERERKKREKVWEEGRAQALKDQEERELLDAEENERKDALRREWQRTGIVRMKQGTKRKRALTTDSEV